MSQYAVESQIRLQGFSPDDSMLLIKPRQVMTASYFITDHYDITADKMLIGHRRVKRS